jgi:GDP-L-fucose synthase
MSKLKIFIAGHNGMVGSALVRFLKNKMLNIITKDRKELDLLNQKDVQNFFKNQKFDQVYLSSCKSWRYSCQLYFILQIYLQKFNDTGKCY